MSGEGLMNAIRYGLAGVLIGCTTSVVGDYIYSKTVAQLVKQQQGQSNTNAGAISQMALNAVVAGASGALIIYAGDQVFESLVGDDFLGHMLFYQSAFFSSATIHNASQNTRAFLVSLGNLNAAATAPKPQPPPQTPPANVSVSTAPPVLTEVFVTKSNKTSSCSKGMCGGVF